MTLRLSFKPCIFFPSLFLFNKISREKVSKGVGGERERKEHCFKLFPMPKHSKQKNYLLSFSEPALEIDFSNYKMKKVSLVFMYLQQSCPISN